MIYAESGSSEKKEDESILAVVPGCVHSDLLTAEKIDDPYMDFSCELQKLHMAHVRLEVVKIEAYRRDFFCLDEGMTAKLLLKNLDDNEPRILTVISGE